MRKQVAQPVVSGVPLPGRGVPAAETLKCKQVHISGSMKHDTGDNASGKRNRFQDISSRATSEQRWLYSDNGTKPPGPRERAVSLFRAPEPPTKAQSPSPAGLFDPRGQKARLMTALDSRIFVQLMKKWSKSSNNAWAETSGKPRTEGERNGPTSFCHCANGHPDKRYFPKCTNLPFLHGKYQSCKTTHQNSQWY